MKIQLGALLVFAACSTGTSTTRTAPQPIGTHPLEIVMRGTQYHGTMTTTTAQGTAEAQDSCVGTMTGTFRLGAR